MLNSRTFRITLRRTKKPPHEISRFVTQDNLECAVLTACQWACWSNDKGRGRRPKFDRWQIEESADGRKWTVIREGDLAYAKENGPEESASETAYGYVLAKEGARKEAECQRARKGGDWTRRSNGRLARLIAEVKAGKV